MHHTEFGLWPKSTKEWEASCFAEPSFSEARVFDVREGYTHNCIPFVQEMSKFLNTNKSDGYILVKTSNAGKRDRNHEISTILLESVLSLIRSMFPKSKIYLSDRKSVV